MTYYLSGALDWINSRLFRNRLTWPCWLLDWAWDKQATPGPARTPDRETAAAAGEGE